MLANGMVLLHNKSMKTVAKNFRIDSELNRQATELLNGLGLSMSQAVSIFLKQVVLQKGLPFEVKYPEYSDELICALKEGESLSQDKNAQTYSTPKELWNELGI